MNYTNKQKELVEEYNKIQDTVQRLVSRQQQILGQLQLLRELVDNNKLKVVGNSNKNNGEKKKKSLGGNETKNIKSP